jgi:hypothetical protein
MKHVDQATIVDKLTEVAGETTSLMVLARQLGWQIEAALTRVALATPAPREIDPDWPAGSLAQALWQACGRRKALIVRTRLSQLAEAEDGHRQPNGNGRDYVARPKNGEAHFASLRNE